MPLPAALLELLGSRAAAGAISELAGNLSVPLRSSAIAAASYDLESETLTVDMTDGSSFDYYACRSKYSSASLPAPSAGGYYNANIRGNFA
jgi:hypothetical protein